MKKYIGEISYKTLSSTLKELEADKLVHREEYPQIPPKVEYSLTERGKSLMPIEMQRSPIVHFPPGKYRTYMCVLDFSLILATIILSGKLPSWQSCCPSFEDCQ